MRQSHNPYQHRSHHICSQDHTSHKIHPSTLVETTHTTSHPHYPVRTWCRCHRDFLSLLVTILEDRQCRTCRSLRFLWRGRRQYAVSGSLPPITFLTVFAILQAVDIFITPQALDIFVILHALDISASPMIAEDLSYLLVAAR